MKENAAESVGLTAAHQRLTYKETSHDRKDHYPY